MRNKLFVEAYKQIMNEDINLEIFKPDSSGTINCSNSKLTSLKGAPSSVGGDFYCNDNKLTSLEGAPKSVGGNFDCSYNPKKFTEAEVRAICNVNGKVII